MRLDWSNIGRGLSSIAQAKMDSDAGAILKRQQEQAYTPEQLADYQANYERTGDLGSMGPGGLTYGATPARTSTPAYYEDGQGVGSQVIPATQGTTVAPQYRLGGLSRATAFSPEEVANQNQADEMAFWKSKGSLGIEMSERRGREKMVGLQNMAAEHEMDKIASESQLKKELAPDMDRLLTLPVGSPEYEVLRSKINARVASGMTPAEQIAFADSSMASAEKRRTIGVAKAKDAIWEASKTPEAALKYFNDQFKDDNTYVMHKNKDGSTSIVQDNSATGGGVNTVATYTDWVNDPRGRDALIARIPEAAAKSWELSLKDKYDKETADTLAKNQSKEKGLDRASAEKIAGMRVAGSASAAKYATAKDALGNMYAKGKDGVHRSVITGEPFDPEIGGELFLLGTQAQAKPVDSIKLAEAVAEYDDNNPPPKLKYTSALGFGNTNAQDEAVYERRVAQHTANRDKFLALARGETPTKGLGTNAVVGKINRGKATATARPAGLPPNAVQAPDGRWGEKQKDGSIRIYKGQ